MIYYAAFLAVLFTYFLFDIYIARNRQ